jgi:hypothetical protein
MIVQAKTRLYIPCPSCTDGVWRADQISIGFKTNWSCDQCQENVSVERISETDFRTTPTGRKNTPVTVTLQSITEPKITLKLNTWKYAHSQNETLEDYESHERYFYNEHTCPTNWTRGIVEIIFEGDHDPHGVFEFVSVVDGHLVDDPFGGAMISEQELQDLEK